MMSLTLSPFSFDRPLLSWAKILFFGFPYWCFPAKSTVCK